MVYQLLCGRDLALKNQMAAGMANYCYLVVNTHDRTAIAVDAAWDVHGMYKLAERLGVKIRGSIYTHYHFDHCGGAVDPRFVGGKKMDLEGAKEVEANEGIVWAGLGDEDMIKEQCKVEHIEAMSDGSVIDCGDLVLHLLHTPGHTPGSICVFAAPQCLSPRGSLGDSPLKESLNKAEAGFLITGDTLFVGSCGRTDFPGSSPQQMMASLARISTMNPDVVVLPGHNYGSDPFTTIGRERVGNPMVRQGLSSIPKPPPLPPCIACDGGRACGPRGFIIGRKVRIRGLQSDAGQLLNGLNGVVERFDDDKERYQVRLLSGADVKQLKADNVESTKAEGKGTSKGEGYDPGEQPPAPYVEAK